MLENGQALAECRNQMRCSVLYFMFLVRWGVSYRSAFVLIFMLMTVMYILRREIGRHLYITINRLSSVSESDV